MQVAFYARRTSEAPLNTRALLCQWRSFDGNHSQHSEVGLRTADVAFQAKSAPATSSQTADAEENEAEDSTLLDLTASHFLGSIN